MLSLPSKPWRNVRLEREKDPGQYRITVLSPLAAKAEFEKIEEEVRGCLGEADRWIQSEWEKKQITVSVADLQRFRRSLIYERIFVAEDDETHKG